MSQPTQDEYIEHCRALRPNAVDGHIKLKLVHSEGSTLLVPDLLVADIDGMRWFQPKFFYGCRLSFLDGFAAAGIGIDLSSGPPARQGRVVRGQGVGCAGSR